MDVPFFKQWVLLTGHTVFTKIPYKGAAACTEIDHGKDLLCMSENSLAMHKP